MILNDTFTPKFVKIRERKPGASKRFVSQVLAEAGRGGRLGRRTGVSKTMNFGLGRGASALVHSGPLPKGARRVVVKARIARHRGASLKAAKVHLRYLQRDGVTREGEAGLLYDRASDATDGKRFMARSGGERHQFRLIVAPEDGEKLRELKPMIRDLMAGMERDLGTKLDWVAVDHFNTGHPHAHVIIRGKTDRGKDLVISPAYISHAIRMNAQKLVTLELGPETALERLNRMRRETVRHGYTALDTRILKTAERGIWTVSPGTPAEMRAQLIARLRTLSTLGLAEEKRPGVFAIQPSMAEKLRDLGRRQEAYERVGRALREAGLSRPSQIITLFDSRKTGDSIRGEVVATGLADDLSDRHYAVIASGKSRVHYAEFNMRPGREPPAKGAMVEMTAFAQARSPHLAHIRTLSHSKTLGI
ncbi:MAG: relaxase/mobilization nuclease domain-containing protein [Chitinophagales bacterium]|nr:relaxase/mobilization nuclease domain-containing protein [Hyphomicrobiales bacterium]